MMYEKNGTLQCSIKKEQKSSPEMALSFQTFFFRLHRKSGIFGWQ